jgi:hypothetical protein
LIWVRSIDLQPALIDPVEDFLQRIGNHPVLGSAPRADVALAGNADGQAAGERRGRLYGHLLPAPRKPTPAIGIGDLAARQESGTGGALSDLTN